MAFATIARPSRYIGTGLVSAVRTIVRVVERVTETPSTVTLRFDYAPPAVPGHFVMVWVPGVDVLPMALSYTTGTRNGVTFKRMGDTSERVQRIGPGTLLGVRGPYGNRVHPAGRPALAGAGGAGAAALGRAV